MASLVTSVWTAGSAAFGFGIWLVLVALALESTPLNLLTGSLLPFFTGIFAAHLAPNLYLTVGLGLMLVEARHLMPALPGEWKTAVGRHLRLTEIALKSQQCIETLESFPRARGIMQHLSHQPGITRRGSVLFLAWFPLVLRWSTVFRLVASATVVLVVHIGFLLHFPLHSADEQQHSDLLRLAQYVKVEFRRLQTRLFALVGVFVAMVWVLNFYLVVVLFVLAVCGLVTALRYDERLRQNYGAKLSSVVKILPNADLVEQAMQQFLIPYEIMLANLQCMVESVRQDKKEPLLFGWAVAGAGTGLGLTLLTWLLHLCTPHLKWVPRLVLLSVAFVSHGVRDETALGRSVALLCGIAAFLTLEMALTGYACACPIGSALNTVLLPLYLLTHVVWLWVAALGVIAILQLHSWNLRLRKLMFNSWLLSGEDSSMTITVPEASDHQMLQLALEQVSSSVSRRFDVKFDPAVTFTTDGIDMNGLSKHFCSLVSKAVREAPDGRRAWPFMRVWDVDVPLPTYHLNFEAHFFQCLMINGDYTPDQVENDYRKLGSLVAMIFMKQVPFLRLSTALIKFLLRDQASAQDDQVDPSLAISLDDLREMHPALATQIADPSLAGSGDEHFNTCGLKENILDQGTIQISTDAPNPWEPSAQNCEQVARKVLENHFVLPVMTAFREGFQTRLQMDSLGQLFSPKEVQAMLAGSDRINVVDWRSHTRYPNGNNDHPVVKMFWRTLMQCTQEQLQELLMEATGQPTPPAAGFRDLEPTFTLAVFEPGRADDRLRRGRLAFHTCFNTIDLLAATTEQELLSFLGHLKQA